MNKAPVLLASVLLAACLASQAAFAAPAALAPGAVAPAFELPSNDGKTLGTAALRGRIVLLNFWASWCGPCRTEMPVLNQLAKQYAARGVTVVGVNVEPERAAALEWLKGTPVNFPVAFDADSRVSASYQVTGMPTTVILDRKGVVRYIHKSYTPGTENEYLDQIRALIRE
jgi:DsbE subfamily thiol:disulfide oxidoreductase